MGALKMAQKLEAEPRALRGTLDKSRDIRNDKACTGCDINYP